MPVYIKNNNNWNSLANVYTKHQGNWHLVDKIYIKNTSTWELAWEADANITTFEYPGDYEYTVPPGVYNLNVIYPTTSTLVVTTVTNVLPGEKIPVTIGGFGSSSTFGTSVVAPIFDTQVISFSGEVGGQLVVEFSVSTPTGVAYVSGSSIPNPDHTAGAAAVGAYWSVRTENGGTYSSNVTMTPVPNSVLLNDATISYTYYNGRIPSHAPSSISKNGDYNTVSIYTDDVAPVGAAVYAWTLNLQQVVPFIVKPTGP